MLHHCQWLMVEVVGGEEALEEGRYSRQQAQYRKTCRTQCLLHHDRNNQMNQMMKHMTTQRVEVGGHDHGEGGEGDGGGDGGGGGGAGPTAKFIEYVSL